MARESKKRIRIGAARIRDRPRDVSPDTMPSAPARSSTAMVRRVLIWLLVLVVSTQSVAAGMAAVEGPMHTHRSCHRPFLLDDFRRHLSPGQMQGSGLSAWFGHGHAHAHVSPQRHHHAPGDPSVQRSADVVVSDSINADGGTTSFAAFLALLAEPSAWQAMRISESLACAPLWAATVGFRGRLERPPRAL